MISAFQEKDAPVANVASTTNPWPLKFELPLATKVSIHQNFLKIVRQGGSHPGTTIVPFNDIGGATVESGFVLTVHTFVLENTGICGGQQRVQKDIRIPCCNKVQADTARLNLLNATERRPLHSLRPRRHLLVLINPFSGTRKAPKVFDSVRHILTMRGATLQTVETTHPNHAKQLITDLNVADVDGIVTVSGDGLLSEVIQGMMSNNSPNAIKLPIGVIPGGTGNAVAYSMCHYAGEPFDPVSCALLINSNNIIPLDLAEVTQGHGSKPIWAFSGVYWGLIADIDLESEVCRSMGSLRNDVYSALRIANLRRYSGILHYRYKDEPMKTIEGEFTLFAAVNLSWVDSGSVLISPDVRPDCGYWDIMFMQSPSRLQLLWALLTGANPIKPSYSTTIRATEFTLVPNPRTLSKPGHIDIDGEEVAFNTTTVKVKPGMARIMGRCTVPGEYSEQLISTQPAK